MNKKLKRLLQPAMGVYLFVLAGFCVAALFMRQYWLALGEIAVTALVFSLYLMDKNRRRQELRRYLQSVPSSLESSGKGDSPFPAVMVRLSDGGIIWTNQKFVTITGFSDTMTEQYL